jgi:hypothetical protein
MFQLQRFMPPAPGQQAGDRKQNWSRFIHDKKFRVLGENTGAHREKQEEIIG